MAKQADVDEQLLAELASLPLFTDLGEATRQNKKERQALSDFHRFRICPRNEIVIEQGQHTTEFYVLLQGTVAAFRADEGRTRRLGTLAVGEWFGEMSAMSHRPAVATVLAEEPSLLLVLDRPLFKVLREGNKGDNAFRRLVDEEYRERALALHLRVAPLLAGLNERELDAIRLRAELVMFEEGDVFARQGEEADAVYLVRSGAVKCVRSESTGEQRILAYFRDNSSFGENTLVRSDREWRGTYTAMGPTDAVKLPRELFEEAFSAGEAGEPGEGTMARLLAQAERIVARDYGRVEELDIMVRRESAKGGRALVIDLDKCTRCNACVESCVAVHEDGVPRLSKKGNRIMTRGEAPAPSEAAAPSRGEAVEPEPAGQPSTEGQNLVLSSACYSCAIPDCMQACDYGAIRRDVNGSIRFVLDNCTGCTLCVPACPYDVIRMTPPPDVARSRSAGFLEGLPWIGKLFARAPKEVQGAAATGAAPPTAAETAPGESEPEGEVEPGAQGSMVLAARTGKKVAGKAIKCDLCAGLPYEACVYNCPCGAIERIDPSALFETRGPA